MVLHLPVTRQKLKQVAGRHLDEKVAALHLAKVGATLSQLNADQAACIGVEQQGPFKGDQYRY